MGHRRRTDAPPGFEEFTTARYPALVRLGTLLSGDPHHGEDLTQTALVAVLRAWPRLHPDGDPESCARRVMTRLAGKAGRRRWRGEVPTEPLPDGELLAPQDRVADTVDAQRLLAGLPTPLRQVLVLRFWLDYGEARTAAELGCSIGTVKSRTHRALARLRATVSRPTTGTGGVDRVAGRDEAVRGTGVRPVPPPEDDTPVPGSSGEMSRWIEALP